MEFDLLCPYVLTSIRLDFDFPIEYLLANYGNMLNQLGCQKLSILVELKIDAIIFLAVL